MAEKADELVALGRVIEALCNLGYKIAKDVGGEDFVVLDIPEADGEWGEIVLDTSRNPVPLEDVIYQLAGAGVDRSVFLTLLDAVP